MPADIALAPHPLLRAAVLRTRFPRPLGDITVTAQTAALLRVDAPAPVQRSEPLRQAVRDLLRHGGYRPTGRGKPASEYLVHAAETGRLGSINAAVDVCNIVSLHSGLPISVVDTARALPPYRVEIAAEGERYVFNPSGQEIELAGLLCLFDALGPCANAVRDAQRTKTGTETVATLSVVWGVVGYEELLENAVKWYEELLGAVGAVTG